MLAYNAKKKEKKRQKEKMAKDQVKEYRGSDGLTGAKAMIFSNRRSNWAISAPARSKRIC